MIILTELRKFYSGFFLTFSFVLILSAVPISAVEREVLPDIYLAYQRALEKHVDAQGGVDYQSLAADPTDLSAFIRSLEAVKPADYSLWPESDKIAFWINVYNGFTLSVILDHYPIQGRGLKGTGYPKNSIRQIPGVWKKVKLSVMGKDLSLNDIEHNILRQEFEEPGIHVALVCASRSCPPLRRMPYTGEMLDTQLDEQARIFLSQNQNFRIEVEKNTVYLSSIFKWYKKDFAAAEVTIEKIPKLGFEETAVIRYIQSYVPESTASYLLKGGYRIRYLKYDWSLNEKQQP